MPNPGQPTISSGATGETVRRLQRALRRTPNLGLVVDGVFGPATENAVKEFQQGSGLVVDGIVGPQTWAALPNGASMPILHQGSAGAVVSSLQQILSNGASGQWNTSPAMPPAYAVANGIPKMNIIDPTLMILPPPALRICG